MTQENQPFNIDDRVVIVEPGHPENGRHGRVVCFWSESDRTRYKIRLDLIPSKPSELFHETGVAIPKDSTITFMILEQ